MEKITLWFYFLKHNDAMLHSEWWKGVFKHQIYERRPNIRDGLEKTHQKATALNPHAKQKSIHATIYQFVLLRGLVTNLCVNYYCFITL